MLKNDAYYRLESIAEEMRELVNEAREIAREFKDSSVNMPNANAYIFEQLEEHINNNNPYNQSIMSLANDIYEGEEIMEDDDEE